MLYQRREPAYTKSIAEQYVGDIWEHLGTQPPELKVIVFDGEWRLGAKRADVAIIKLLNDEAPYLFCLTRIMGENATSLPECLTALLQSPSIIKIGN